MARAYSITVNRDDVLSTLQTKFPSSATEDDYLDILNKIYPNYNAIATVDSISVPDGNRTEGVFSNVAYTGGSGTGATFTITIDDTGAASIAVGYGGRGYVIDDTITVADSELGGGGGPSLTFDVATVTANSSKEITFNRNISRTSKHRTLVAQFGDGYEQRVLDGINSKTETFALLFSNRDWEEVELLSALFDAKAAQSFNIVLQRESLKVVCDDYNVMYSQSTIHTISANVRRVYEP